LKLNFILRLWVRLFNVLLGIANIEHVLIARYLNSLGVVILQSLHYELTQLFVVLEAFTFLQFLKFVQDLHNVVFGVLLRSLLSLKFFNFGVQLLIGLLKILFLLVLSELSKFHLAHDLISLFFYSIMLIKHLQVFDFQRLNAVMRLAARGILPRLEYRALTNFT
jgi:hypothetical protein